MEDTQLFADGGEAEFLKLIEEIPIAVNSDFQIRNIVLNELSPHRVYRQVVLEMHEKYKALKQCQFRRRKLEIELRKLEKKMKEEKDADERELIQVDIDEKNFELTMEIKLIQDALVEWSTYMSIYKKLPKMTRKEFELAEPEYWQKRAVRQAERDVQTTGVITQGNIELLQKLNMPPVQVQEDLRRILFGGRQARPSLLARIRHALLPSPQGKKETSQP